MIKPRWRDIKPNVEKIITLDLATWGDADRGDDFASCAHTKEAYKLAERLEKLYGISLEENPEDEEIILLKKGDKIIRSFDSANWRWL